MNTDIGLNQRNDYDSEIFCFHHRNDLSDACRASRELCQFTMKVDEQKIAEIGSFRFHWIFTESY